MVNRDEAVNLLTANPDHNLAKTIELERQQVELLARLNALIDALSRVDAHLATALESNELVQALGQALKRLGMNCLIALLEPETHSLVVHYLSIEPSALARLDELVGDQVIGLHLPRRQFGIYDQLIECQHPLYVTDGMSVIAPLLPGLSPSALERAGGLVGVTPDSRAAYLRMSVGEGVQGVMSVWGEDLWESDLPALSVFAGQAATALDNARLRDEVRDLRERLKRLVRRLVSAQEEERQRISRELHDEAGQALTALKISLELIRADLSAELQPFRHRLGEASVLVDRTLEQIHWISQGLRPPILDAIGLNQALESYCRDFTQRTRLSVDYHGLELAELSGVVSISIYRFLQEALTNVAKHARAKRVQVMLLNGADTLKLIVEDDGQGFDPNAGIPSIGKPAGLGLIGLRERFEFLGGQLKIESHPGLGARLVASIPLSEVE